MIEFLALIAQVLLGLFALLFLLAVVITFSELRDASGDRNHDDTL